jgi:flagellar protein FliS
MWNNGHETYLESGVLGADPLELVNLLYQGCRQAVRDAREHLAAARIAERSRAISKACEILTELAASLDHTHASGISQSLALLYDYMQRRMLDANMRQVDEPLAEVLALLTTLGEAWESVNRSASKPASQVESPWSQPAPIAPAHAGAAHAWRF